VNAGGQVATPTLICADFSAALTILDKQKLAANGNPVPRAPTLGTHTIDTQSIIRAKIPTDNVPNRRFPPPWSAEDIGACFLVKDSNGQKLVAVYYEEEPAGGRRRGCSAVKRPRGLQ
jgi:hypothetical protein